MSTIIYSLASILIFLLIAITIPDEDRKSNIRLEDILVGDTVSIKGEKFKVVAYSENGIMEITDGKENYFIKVNEKNIKFVLHYSGGNRKYIEIQGTKSTVGGDYLNDIKFN